MINTINLSKDQCNQICGFMNELSRNEIVYLDYEHIQRNQQLIQPILNASNRTKHRYPYLHDALDNYQKYVGAPKENVMMIDGGQTHEGQPVGTVWCVSDTDVYIQGGTLMAFHPETNELLAYGSNSSNNGFLAVSTETDSYLDTGAKLNFLYLGHVSDKRFNTRLFVHFSEVKVNKQGVNIHIEQPVITQPKQHRDEILIAVGRKPQWANTDADYVYIDTDNKGQPFLIVPFAGHVALPKNIDNSRLSSVYVNTFLYVDNINHRGKVLARAQHYTTKAKLLDGLRDSSGNTFKWNYRFDGLNHGDKNFSNTRSLVFNPGSLTSQKITHFYCQFNNIPIGTDDYAFPITICSKGYPKQNVSNNARQVDNIMFWWHCLIEGTFVTLEDGSQCAIEDLNDSHRVKTGIDGLALTVRATVIGEHQSDPADQEQELIYELKTENGKQIIATQSHTIFLSDGNIRSIMHVAGGDEVLTDEGVSKVINNKPIKESGLFYGLALGNDEEQQKADFPKGKASYYANGILTGDHRTLKSNALITQGSELSHLGKDTPKDFHIDLQSAIEDMIAW